MICFLCKNYFGNRSKINYFKRSKKHNLAKTDKMDSYILSLYGKENLNNLKLYEPNINTKDLSNLKAIESRLEELKQTLVQEKNRLQAPALDNLLKKDINLSLKQLENRIAKLERESTHIIDLFPK
jgi:small-conductance mechanosensitive channel